MTSIDYLKVNPRLSPWDWETVPSVDFNFSFPPLLLVLNKAIFEFCVPSKQCTLVPDSGELTSGAKTNLFGFNVSCKLFFGIVLFESVEFDDFEDSFGLLE